MARRANIVDMLVNAKAELDCSAEVLLSLYVDFYTSKLAVF